MADIHLIVQELRANGHTVADVHPVPANAGDYELMVDGEQLTLEQARLVLEADADKAP